MFSTKEHFSPRTCVITPGVRPGVLQARVTCTPPPSTEKTNMNCKRISGMDDTFDCKCIYRPYSQQPPPLETSPPPLETEPSTSS